MTANPASIVDSDNFTVSRTITIAAPVDKVWAAITEATHLAQWFGEAAVLDEVAVGALGSITWHDYGTLGIRIEELDPPHAITYRWNNENGRATGPIDPEHSTVFRFTLEPTAAGTQLTVVESGFESLTDPAASLEGNRGGWDFELDELVAYLEGGS